MEIEFIGAAQTVTGSMHLLRTKARDGPARLRALPGAAARIDSSATSTCPSTGEGQRGRALARAHRSLGRAADAGQARLRRAHLRDAGDARSLRGDAARRRRDPGVRRALPQSADRARATPRSRGRAALRGRGRDARPRLLPSRCPTTARSTSRPGVRLTFLDAGHVLGSAITVLDVEEDGQKRRVVFTGDLGRARPADPARSRDPRAAPNVLITESTYGDRLHDGVEQDGRGSRERWSTARTSAGARCSSRRSRSSARRRWSSR